MSCLTPEQLAAIALEFDGAEFPAHVDDCADCRAKLTELRQLSSQLATAHADLNRRHTTSRERLLDQLSHESRVIRATRWKRFAFGGLGLSSAAAVLLIVGFFAMFTNQLSAMERMVKAVREVTSFSCKWAYRKDNPETAQKPGRTLDCINFIYWKAPHDSKRDEFGDLRAGAKNEAVYHSATSDKKPELLTDLIEIHPSGQSGILIDYVAKKYFRVPPLHASDIANSEPLLWLQAVREKAGRITEELGTRQIAGREARGYIMTFDNAAPFNDFGPVEVWVDPQTDLPIEFTFQYAKAEKEGFTDRHSVTDIQWNIDLDPKLFDTTPPAGFVDVTLPNDERSIVEIVAALKLYAELSHGRYPHVDKLDDRNFATRFDAAACYGEMLKLAGFIGPQRVEWASDPSYQRIQQSRPGLEMLERILRSYKWLVGYNGATIGPKDKDKVLLWWNIVRENVKAQEYCVFYGDLRTEVVPRAKWVQLVPPEIAEATE